MRSKLFVPGVRPELFAKALAGDADALSFDLEDSVPEDLKQVARSQVAGFVDSETVRGTSKVIVVRINALDTAHVEADLMAMTRPGVDMINLPKVESADAIRELVAMLERAEAANGVSQPIRILATIESPRGLRCAAEIAAAHPRMAGLQVGYADLFEPFAIDRNDPANRHAVLFAVRMATAEAGVFACDGAFASLEDAQGFREEAQVAQRLGYIGKSCIHPKQVAMANDVFMPSAEERAAAQRIVDAAGEASAQGRGAFVVDGRMVDLPFLKRAHAILAALPPNASQS
jgi:citrate lyase beta subunit